MSECLAKVIKVTNKTVALTINFLNYFLKGVS